MSSNAVYRRLSLVFLALSVAGGLAGCRSGKPVGQVSGTLTYQRKPVAEGIVSFLNPETGDSEEANVKDGKFTVSRPMPVGEYKVMVLPMVRRERADPRGPVVGVTNASDIPEKYQVIGSTDLRATVKEGDNTLTLEMKR